MNIVNNYKSSVNILKNELYNKIIHNSKDTPESIKPLNEYIKQLNNIRLSIKQYFEHEELSFKYDIMNDFFSVFNKYSNYDKDSIKLMLIDYTDLALHCYPFVKSL